MTMEEPGLVFHVIAEAGENVNIVNSFIEHLTDVFAHVKKEILEFCESLSMSNLLLIRAEIFNQLQSDISVDQYELCDRRKIVSLAEDVYVLGFSLVSKSPHKNLYRILKKTKTTVLSSDQSTEIDVSTDDRTEITELVTICTTLKKSVKDLQMQLAEVTKRLATMENEIDRLKGFSKEDSSEKSLKNCQEGVNSSNPVRQIEITAEVHRDKYSNKQFRAKPEAKPLLKTTNENVDAVDTLDHVMEDDEDFLPVFRHSERERKNILKKPRRSSPRKLKSATVYPTNSTDTTVKAPKTYLVYIGKLEKDTSETSIRHQLMKKGVDRADIADIMRLKT